MRARLTLRVLVSETPAAVAFWMVPPLLAEPSPVTESRALPVLFSTMPLPAPLAEMLWKVNWRLLWWCWRCSTPCRSQW